MGNQANSGSPSYNCANKKNGCNVCNDLGDRQTDTVKVDLDSLRSRQAEAEANPPAGSRDDGPPEGKENSFPSPRRGKEESLWLEAEAQQQVEKRRGVEGRRRKEEEEQRQRWEESRRAKEEEERRRREQARLERERQLLLIEQLRKQEEEEEAERLRAAVSGPSVLPYIAGTGKEEARLFAEAQHQKELEAARVREMSLLQERKMLEEKRRKQQEKAKLERFLKAAGFGGPGSVNAKKTKKGILSSSFLYPLHAAVDANDVEMLNLLLKASADPTLLDSKGRTPLERAAHLEKKNKKIDYAELLDTLNAAEVR